MVQNIKSLNIFLLLFYNMRKILVYLFCVCILTCCKKQDEVSFAISLKETIPLDLVEFQQNISVMLNYEHPEGYIGFFDPDFLSLEVKDSRLPNADYYHIVPLDPPDHTLSIKGSLLIEIDAPFLFGNGDSETLTFTIRILDRDNQWSNKVTTPVITINKQ